MAFIHIPKPWQLPERRVTLEAAYWNRRRFLKSAVGMGIGASVVSAVGCDRLHTDETEVQPSSPPVALADLKDLTFSANAAFANLERPLTNRQVAATYNNFYEFGGTKNIWEAAQALPTDPWTVKVTGLVNQPKTYDRDELARAFPLEERVYRFRCVEAWSMVVPWIGFPMRSLLEAVDPKPEAKFVRFTSYYDKAVTTGPSFTTMFLPWPYTEALRVEEMANELAFFAVGIYGQTLPEQHGAPIRMVVPWKYGFKGAKSIVKIEFVAEQPATYWNTIAPNEYGFESNVDPSKPHPRWSQAEERLIGPEPEFTTTTVPTLPYNGYGEYVADLYA
ncbi:MAG: protein-methionine-sulfoxide reductase catalytic subunit MsrP [Elainellaceae cyanobacterium]